MAVIAKVQDVITITLTTVENKAIIWAIQVWGGPQTTQSLQDWVDAKIRDYNSQQKENLVAAYTLASPAIKAQVKALLGSTIEP